MKWFKQWRINHAKREDLKDLNEILILFQTIRAILKDETFLQGSCYYAADLFGNAVSPYSSRARAWSPQGAILLAGRLTNAKKINMERAINFLNNTYDKVPRTTWFKQVHAQIDIAIDDIYTLLQKAREE